MAKKYISHQPIWLLIIIATYVTGGSCHSCNRNRTATPKSTSKPKSTPTASTPIDNADSASSTSSGYASDSDGSPSSGSSGSSNFSSGSASSSRSSSPAPLTDFAGLTNIGNTCFMNTVLQIIAALYEDKVQTDSGLQNLVNKINKGHEPLSREEIAQFVKSLPNNAQRMVEKAQSGTHQDPHEFILNLENRLKLDPIGYYKRLIFRTKEIENNKEVVRLREQINSCKDKDCKEQCKHSEHQLFVGMDKEGTPQRSLSDMVALSREELMDKHPVERRSIGAFYQGPKSSFLEKNENNLKFQYSESSNLKYYIEQQVIEKSKIPSILYVQLKRFTAENNKIDTPIDGAFELTIKPDPNLKETIHFDLHGFILHIGTTSSGHYVAYVKRNEQWYKADDDRISKVSESTAINESKQAYLLFYKKK